MNPHDQDLLQFLYNRYKQCPNTCISASHADQLNHIPDLSACWNRLFKLGLVSDDDGLSAYGIEWKIFGRWCSIDRGQMKRKSDILKDAHALLVKGWKPESLEQTHCWAPLSIETLAKQDAWTVMEALKVASGEESYWQAYNVVMDMTNGTALRPLLYPVITVFTHEDVLAVFDALIISTQKEERVRYVFDVLAVSHLTGIYPEPDGK